MSSGLCLFPWRRWLSSGLAFFSNRLPPAAVGLHGMVSEAAISVQKKDLPAFEHAPAPSPWRGGYEMHSG